MTYINIVVSRCLALSLSLRDSLAFLDGYCSTLQGLLDWFEVDLGFTELLSLSLRESLAFLDGYVVPI